MQAIWSRAAQTHSCSCRACLRATGAVVRGSATKVSPRKVSLSDVFTACYSTLMAAALIADTNGKKKRQSDLTRRISEAQADLDHVMQLADIHDTGLPRGVRGVDLVTSPSRVIEALKSICVNVFQLRRHAAAAEQRNLYLSQIHHNFLLTRKWAYQRTVPVDLSAVQDACIAEPPSTEREPRTNLQFARGNDMVNVLVDELLFEAHRLAYPGDPEAVRRSIENLDGSCAAIRMLRSEGYPTFQHPDLDPIETANFRRDLDVATRRVFAEWERAPPAQRQPRWTNRWVFKLCYNVLVAGVPPSMQNYNALILGFTRLGEHSLARLVVEFFLCSGHLKPTRQTIVCLLHHYRAKGDITGFYSIIRRITGLHHRGIKIRDKSFETVELSPTLQAWARGSDVAIANGFVLQRQQIDANLFRALVEGLLHFDQIQHATRIFVAYLEDEWVADTGILNILNQLVNRTLDAVDSASARLLLQGLVKHADLVAPFFLGGDASVGNLVAKTQLLLDIAAPGLPRKSLLGQSMTRSNSDANAQAFTLALFLEDVNGYLVRLGEVLAWILGSLSSDLPLDTATRGMVELDRLTASQRRFEWRRLKYRRMAKLRGIDRRVAKLANRTMVLTERLLAAVSSSMPPIYAAFLRREDVPFLQRFESYMAVVSAKPTYEETNQQVKRAIYAGGKLEEELRQILLRSLSADERQRLGKEDPRMPLKVALRAWFGRFSPSEEPRAEQSLLPVEDSVSDYSFTIFRRPAKAPA